MTIKQMEQFVLLAVQKLAPNATCSTVQDELSRVLNHKYAYSAIYTVMSNMDEAGWLKSKDGINRGQAGRASRLYDLTAEGRRALKTSLKYIEQLQAA